MEKGWDRLGATAGAWRTSPEQRSYKQRLLKALRSAGADATPADRISRSFAVKEAADSALAMSAKGHWGWSRAILARWRRRRERFMSRKIRRVSLRMRAAMMEPSSSVPAAENNRRTPAKRKRGGKEDSMVDDRLRTLGRLIPGGQKLGAPASSRKRVTTSQRWRCRLRRWACWPTSSQRRPRPDLDRLSSVSVALSTSLSPPGRFCGANGLTRPCGEERPLYLPLSCVGTEFGCGRNLTKSPMR
ncbi:Transcription factor [Nymphaea thermarum]|nr:Transcription factor [Nymphaea thermarum]